MIRVNQQAIKFLENNYNNYQIYGSDPEIYYLTQDYQGYVSRPLQFKYCTEFAYQKGQSVIFYRHLYTPMQLECEALINKLPAIPLKIFEVNGKWIQLFMVKM